MTTVLNWHKTSEKLPEKLWQRCLLAYEVDGEFIIAGINFWHGDHWQERFTHQLRKEDQRIYDRLAKPNYWTPI